MKRWALTLCLLFYTTTAFATSGPASIGAHVLAQANPPATSLTDIYTAPHYGNITTVWIANRDTVPHLVRMSLAPLGVADAPTQYIYYDISIPGNSSLVQAVDLPLQPTDVVRVYVDAQKVSVSLFGNMQP